MAVPDTTTVFTPGTLSQFFSLWTNHPSALPVAGETALIRNNSLWADPELPVEILSLEKIDELRSITRTERYLEIVAMVRLSEIIALGKIVPGAFSQTMEGIGSPELRNLATIGGNICSGGDTKAPLCALDALFELRNTAGSRWIPALHFSTKTNGLQKGEILTRIRIPLEEWNYTVYRKINALDSGKGVLILLVRNQKNILTHIQVVFSGEIPILYNENHETTGIILRNKDSEFELEGKALPLDKRDLTLYMKNWETYLAGMENMGLFLRNIIIKALETGIRELSD